MSRARYFAFGNISIDDLVFADGKTTWCVPGGNSIYSALGMAVWGERPQVTAPIGPEYPLAKLGGRIDISQCRPIERTLRNWGLYEEDGTRHFTFRSKTRNWVDFCPMVSDLDDGPYVFCHLAPLPWDLHYEFATALRAKGANLISIDPDDRRLHEVPLREVARLLTLVDVFMPSRQDIAALFPESTPVDALRALRELAPDTPVIMIKCGAAGAIAHQSHASDYLSAPSAAERAIDETGAGDAFCGGALVGFSRKLALGDALTRAVVSASFAVDAVGPAALISASVEVAEQRASRVSERIDVRRL